MSTFSSFPVELHEQILSLLDPEDIISLRKTSKYFFALAQGSRLWTTIRSRMHQTHPLGYSHSELAALTHRQSERVFVLASKTQKMFQTLRDQPQHRIFPGEEIHKGRLVVLSFLSERFLLSVYDSSVMYVWDLSNLGSSAGTSAVPCARLMHIGWNFLGHGVSNDNSTLCVVLSQWTGSSAAQVFSLSLPSMTPHSDEPSFRFTACFDTHFNKVCNIDPDSRLILLREESHPIIEVIDWCTKRQSRILLQVLAGTHPDTNYVQTLCICGPYILCFRCFSIDAYPNPLQSSERGIATPLLPIHQIAIAGVVPCTRVRLSHVRCIQFQDEGADSDVIAYSICALIHDASEKTYCYQVSVRGRMLASTLPLWTFFTQRLADRHGAVSASDIGASGLRGVWLSRATNTNDPEQHVVAFTMPSCPSQAVFDETGSGSNMWPRTFSQVFEERVVWVVTPQCDPTDEVTLCAVSEYTGRIALGTHKGVINVI